MTGGICVSQDSVKESAIAFSGTFVFLASYALRSEWELLKTECTLYRFHSLVAKKHNGAGSNMCKLHENINYYKLEIDAELGSEDDFVFVDCFSSVIVFPQSIMANIHSFSYL